MKRLTLKVGITEAGDPSVDFGWLDKLLLANIIITKNLTNTMIGALLANKKRVILHITCTGFGGTKIEPNVPTVMYTYHQVKKLIKAGFPVSQIVLRIDPIVPIDGILDTTVRRVLEIFKNTNIRRVRYSWLDMYDHVKKRLHDAGLDIPYETFTCPPEIRKTALKLLESYSKIYIFESCAEDNNHSLGCISQKDFDILKIKSIINPVGRQRMNCLCSSGKTELLTIRGKCSLNCIYCYWKH